MSQHKRKAGSYPVGYGKPPTATRFIKGKSGNPSGLPKNMGGNNHSYFDAAMRVLTRTITVRIGNKAVRMPIYEAIYRKRAELALKGDTRAMRACLDDAAAFSLGTDRHAQLFARVADLESLNPKEAIDNLSQEQLRGLLYIIDTTLEGHPEEKRSDAITSEPGSYVIAVGSLPSHRITRVKTAREALPIVTSARVSGEAVRIVDTRGIEITEAGLRTLAEREEEESASR